METRRLDELCVQITDCPHSTPQWLSSGKLVLRNFNIHNGRIDLSNVSYTDDETFFARNKRATPIPGDIVMSREAPMGEVAIIPNGFECCLGQRMVLLHPDATVCNGKFLMYSLLSPFVQKQIKRSDTTGSVVSNLCIPDLCALEIPYVNIERQECIVALLSDIDSKIDNNNAISAELEGMAKDLYDYWFVQFDFPDENGNPYKSSGGKMVWNEELKREIPEGWEVDRLGKHITSSRGISYNSATLEGDGVPMINLASFGVDSNYKPAGIKTYNGQYDADKILRPFDLIMCNTQQTAVDPTKDIIGKAMLVPDIFDGDVVSSHHITTIAPDVDELKYYIYSTCKTTWFHKYIVGFASGTNILGLDFKGFEDYLMPLPPMRLLQKFATTIKNIESEKSLIITENIELTSFRDFLLPMLMNGQVKVKGRDI